MNKSSKAFLVLAVFLVLASTQTACTQQKKDINTQPKAELNSGATATEAVAATYANIFPISKVAAPVANKIVDISFMKDGKEMSLLEYTKGKYVFLNFWGTWCPPCRAEIPHIVEIQSELGADLVVVGISLERAGEMKDAIKTAGEFSAKNNINYMNIVVNNANPLKANLAAAYGGLQYVPTTFLIDKSGNVFEMIQGGRSKEAFMESINKMKKKS